MPLPDDQLRAEFLQVTREVIERVDPEELALFDEIQGQLFLEPRKSEDAAIQEMQAGELLPGLIELTVIFVRDVWPAAMQTLETARNLATTGLLVQMVLAPAQRTREKIKHVQDISEADDPTAVGEILDLMDQIIEALQDIARGREQSINSGNKPDYEDDKNGKHPSR